MRDVAWAPHTGLAAPILASAGEDGKVRREEGREGGREGGRVAVAWAPHTGLAAPILASA